MKPPQQPSMQESQGGSPSLSSSPSAPAHFVVGGSRGQKRPSESPGEREPDAPPPRKKLKTSARPEDDEQDEQQKGTSDATITLPTSS